MNVQLIFTTCKSWKAYDLGHNEKSPAEFVVPTARLSQSCQARGKHNILIILNMISGTI
jgi:hypothetical protein